MPEQQRKFRLLQQRLRLERQLAAIHHNFQRIQNTELNEPTPKWRSEPALNELEHSITSELAQIRRALEQLGP